MGRSEVRFQLQPAPLFTFILRCSVPLTVLTTLALAWMGAFTPKTIALKIPDSHIHSTYQSSPSRISQRFGPDGLSLREMRNADISPNWSGYVVTSGNYTSVQGTWTVPAVTYVSYPGAPAVEASATWVGIGGYNEPTLIQLGTSQIAAKSGAVNYGVWYEILPAPNSLITATQFVVSPGDTITASIQCTALCTPKAQSTWVLSMTNGNRWKTPFTIQLTYASTFAAAEWIMEATCLFPCDALSNGTINPANFSYLPNFGSTAFTAISANNANPNLSLSPNAIILTDPNGKAQSRPSDAVGGNSFLVNFVGPRSP
jgi:Peptidase A4 family